LQENAQTTAILTCRRRGRKAELVDEAGGPQQAFGMTEALLEVSGLAFG